MELNVSHTLGGVDKTYSIVVYYKSRKRELKIRLMNESRCDVRLKTRVQEAICLSHTGLHDKTN
jgi:hypothetical protein